MFPVINTRATGINLRRIMDSKNISVKDLQQLLGLSSHQSIYHWLNGICLPSLDNLYAMSIFFGIPMDEMIKGNYRTTRIQLMLYWESISPGHRIYIINGTEGRLSNITRVCPDYTSVHYSIKSVFS